MAVSQYSWAGKIRIMQAMFNIKTAETREEGAPARPQPTSEGDKNE